MADKQINELEAASSVGTTDLFVLEQANTAKKLTGQILMNDLAEALDGHGGIASIDYVPPVSPSLEGELEITLADETVVTVPVRNGRGIASIVWVNSGTAGDGQTHTGTITYNDGTTSTIVIKDGVKGNTGAQTYVYFKWASDLPSSDAAMSDSPDAWVGICSTTASTAPTSYTAYTWYQYKGATGAPGTSITGVEKTGSSGLVDTYTVSFSNGTTTTFTVTNGSSISSIAKTSTSGLMDIYTVTLTNGSTTTFTVTNAKSIASIELTSGNHAAGTTDVYTITFNDGDTATFSVYNGANGLGSVSTVSGIQAVNGDVPQVISGSGPPTTATVGQTNQLYFDTTNSVLYYCLGESGGSYSWAGTSVTVDSALSSSSTNPVQNKAITAKVGTAALNTTAQNLSGAVNELLAAIPAPSSTAPSMDGAAAVGVSGAFARADHVHPSDTSKVDAAGAAAAAPVQSVDGGTGAVDTWAQRFLGNNPISSAANDTVANWRSLGTGWAWYSQLTLTDQPGQWGFLFNIINDGNDVLQIFVVTQTGTLYVRNGYTSYGGAGWVGTWRELATADIITAATITIPASWNDSGNGYYTATPTVTGATITSNSKVDLQPGTSVIAQLVSDGVTALYVENSAGTLTAYALGSAPSAALTAVQCTVTEVS